MLEAMAHLPNPRTAGLSGPLRGMVFLSFRSVRYLALLGSHLSVPTRPAQHTTRGQLAGQFNTAHTSAQNRSPQLKRVNCSLGPVGITEGLTWILVLRYARKWHSAVAVFLSLGESSPFESTSCKRDASLRRAGWARLDHLLGFSCRITLRRPLWTFNPPTEPS